MGYGIFVSSFECFPLKRISRHILSEDNGYFRFWVLKNLSVTYDWRILKNHQGILRFILSIFPLCFLGDLRPLVQLAEQIGDAVATSEVVSIGEGMPGRLGQ